MTMKERSSPTYVSKYSDNLLHRPRRNRKLAALSDLVQETRLHPSDLVAPLFVLEDENAKEPINSMPGIYRLGIKPLIKEVKDLYQLGVRAVDLFALVPNERKTPYGDEALRENNLICRSVAALKEEMPDIAVMVDIALDPYTDHGHDGVIDSSGYVLNDETISILCQMSLLAAKAGCDIVSPSDMMDGRVEAIRRCLDESGYQTVGILSYAAKYCSSFYGPFRDALQSAPKFGDKKSYQMNPANVIEAIREAHLDMQEGADMLLVKPALPYLDVLAKIKEEIPLPVGAYHVSGEYAMVMAADEKGWLDADKVLYESLLSIKRAGADFILTYAAKKICQML